MEKTAYGGWKDNARISNGKIELVVTGEVGPRVIRFGFVGEKNLFAEYKDQLGGKNEKEWQIRGGHRLWIAPEAKPRTYELDNKPLKIRPVKDGLETIQPVGPLSGCQKRMVITMSRNRNEVTVVHHIANKSRKSILMAPWALTVMAPGGVCVIPLPKKIPHTKAILHNQEWSLWAYTDLNDTRFKMGKRYVFFAQDFTKGPNKIGIAHREGWVGYVLDGYLFVKRFNWIKGAQYPDGGVNFETFSNEDMLEVESLGPMTTLKPGVTVKHVERWQLFKNVPFMLECDDVDRDILPLVRKW